MALTIYVDNENKFQSTVRLKTTAAITDLVALGVTRVVLFLAGQEIDSLVDPGAIDFTTEGANGIILFDLTGYSFEPDSYGARIVIYYPDASSGEVVADGLPVIVAQPIT